MIKVILVILVFLFLAGSIQAQEIDKNNIYDKGYTGIAYLSKAEEPNWGFTGGWIRYYEKYNASLIVDGALDLNFEENKQESNSRYYWDSFSNGQKRCRDRQTGRFASNSNCESGSTYETNASIRLSGLINYHFPIDDKIDFIAGVGYMISNISTPLVSVGLTQKLNKSGISGSLGLGKDYLYIGVMYIF